MNKDYSQEEIDHMVNNLLDLHQGKLVKWEVETLEKFKLCEGPLGSIERDWLVGIYSRIGEETY